MESNCLMGLGFYFGVARMFWLHNNGNVLHLLTCLHQSG